MRGHCALSRVRSPDMVTLVIIHVSDGMNLWYQKQISLLYITHMAHTEPLEDSGKQASMKAIILP